METTFDKFITKNAKQKILLDKEYSEFSLSEDILKENQSAKKLKPQKPAARRKKAVAL